MARANDLHKPGEKAPRAGGYFCYLCAQLGIDSRCELKAGDLFLACPNCLKRKVPEWDLTWRSTGDKGNGAKKRRVASRWPGSFGGNV